MKTQLVLTLVGGWVGYHPHTKMWISHANKHLFLDLFLQDRLCWGWCLLDPSNFLRNRAAEQLLPFIHFLLNTLSHFIKKISLQLQSYIIWYAYELSSRENLPLIQGMNSRTVELWGFFTLMEDKSEKWILSSFNCKCHVHFRCRILPLHRCVRTERQRRRKRFGSVQNPFDCRRSSINANTDTPCECHWRIHEGRHGRPAPL